MTIDKATPYGGIDISMQAIAAIAGSAALECYGVVGLSPKNSIFDNVDELLGRENFQQGITAKRTKNGFEVNVYIICATGVKITEIVSEVQKKVKYVLEKTFGIKFQAVNIFVQGLKEVN